MNIIEKLGITPGPWEVTGCYKHLVMIDNMFIADCSTNHTKKPYIPENTRIIAAAPEMLEALIDLARRKEYEAYNAYMDNGWDDKSEKKATEEVKKYTDIIKNATGLEWEKIKELLK